MTNAPAVLKALTRYRILAWVTGLWLILLVFEMVWKYVLSYEVHPWMTAIPVIHGWAYALYLALTLDLAIKARWKPSTTILTLIAGTVPFVSFWFEKKRTAEVTAAFGQN